MINGFININKPASISSNKVLGILKYNLRKIGINEKIGHFGTLDPLATGVLPVALGRATRLFDYSLDKVKVYIAEFIFGAKSESLDTDTEVIFDESYTIPNISDIEKAFKNQIGEIDQIPPKFSAKSVNGERAYKLARKGEDVALPAKKIKIYNIDILDVKFNVVSVKIECGGGTYVRAIGRDAASFLNTDAVMTKLERVESGKFSLKNSVSLYEIEQDPKIILDKIIPIDEFLIDFPKVNVKTEEKKALLDGKRISGIISEKGNYSMYCENVPIGIADIDDNKLTYVKTWLL